MSKSKTCLEIVGAIGVGKSTMLSKFRSDYHEEAGVEKAVSFCLESETLLNEFINPILTSLYSGNLDHTTSELPIFLEEMFLLLRLPLLGAFANCDNELLTSNISPKQRRLAHRLQLHELLEELSRVPQAPCQFVQLFKLLNSIGR